MIKAPQAPTGCPLSSRLGGLEERVKPFCVHLHQHLSRIFTKTWYDRTCRTSLQSGTTTAVVSLDGAACGVLVFRELEHLTILNLSNLKLSGNQCTIVSPGFASWYINRNNAWKTENSRHILINLINTLLQFAGVTADRLLSRHASTVNPLDSKGNYSATSNNMKVLHWPLMGGLLHLVQRGGVWAGCGRPSPLLAVPNVTAHPSTASVPITVLLYDDLLFCGFNVAIKGLNSSWRSNIIMTTSVR